MKNRITSHRCLLGLALFAGVSSSSVHATTTFFTESFEAGVLGDSGLVSSSTAFNDSPNDYWERTNGSTIGTASNANASSAYTGFDGTFFWAAEDVDDDGGNGLAIQQLTIGGIDISGHTNLSVSGLFAADGNPSAGVFNFDSTDYMQVFYQVDGGGYQLALGFEANSGAGSNLSALSLDTNFDGVGDGTALTTAFGSFNFAVADGSTLDIRVDVSVNGSNEEVAFDNFQVTGDVVPEPSSSLLVAFGSLLLLRRKRS